nr:DnaJ domain-containing protein [Sulfurovaceae bacterium]
DIIGMLTKIAKSDNRVSTNEASLISSTIDNFMVIYKNEDINQNDSKRLRIDLINHYKITKDNNKKIESYAYSLAHHSHIQRVKVLQDLVNMADIDGFTETKEDMIYKVGYIFRFDKSQISRYILNVSADEVIEIVDDISDKYNILEVTKDDNFAIVKSKYRQLVKKYHPDTINNIELNHKSIYQAKEKMQELNDAYDAIKKRNFGNY